MLLLAYYARNYAGIIGASLLVIYYSSKMYINLYEQDALYIVDFSDHLKCAATCLFRHTALKPQVSIQV